jgi:hypothetical protein
LLAVPAAIVLLAAAWFGYRALSAPTGVVAGDCLPSEVGSLTARTNPAKRAPPVVRMIVDVSAGMEGYAAAGGANVMGNLVTLTRDFAGSSFYDAAAPGKTEFYGFGAYHFDAASPAAPPRIADPARLGRATAYDQPDTNLKDLLAWIAWASTRPGGEQALSVIVTDLMPDDRSASDDAATQLGGALRNLMIKQHVAVGLLGVRVPFTGPIYWNHRRYSAAMRDRPLMVLMIGDPLYVRTYYDYLRGSQTAPFSDATPASAQAFALFGLKAAQVVPGRIGSAEAGEAFRPASAPLGSKLDAFPVYAMAHDAGQLNVALDADAGVKPYEVSGDQPVSTGRVWQLNDTPEAAPDGGSTCHYGDVWLRKGDLSSGIAAGQRISFRLDPEALERAGMGDKGTYLVQLIAGQAGSAPPQRSAAWMTGWSDTDDELDRRLSADTRAHIGVPGLDKLRRNLLNELMIPGHQQIARSAAQFVVVVH